MKRLVAACLGLGWLPVAPGTWGSLPSAIVFALMSYFHASSGVITLVMMVLALAGSVICVVCAPNSIAATGKADPGEVVADELAGQALTFALASTLLSDSVWATTGGGFLLFRFFDIVKPWPIRKLEKLPKGWGILADDLLASVYAGIALLIVSRLWAYWRAG
jgi:phosphatidylglycerophosphatase A